MSFNLAGRAQFWSDASACLRIHAESRVFFLSSLCLCRAIAEVNREYALEGGPMPMNERNEKARVLAARLLDECTEHGYLPHR